jgi:hypothetical protein
MAKKKPQGFNLLNTAPASAFAIGKATLTLTKNADDTITASISCPGMAYAEFKFGSETGVYGDPVRVSNSFTLRAVGNETVYAVARGIAADGSAGAWSDEANITTAINLMTAFSFAEQTGAAVIDDEAGTVAIEVAFGTAVDALVASFTISDGASAKVGETPQVSGETANDFTNPVEYTVVSAGAAEKTYTVTVTVAAE